MVLVLLVSVLFSRTPYHPLFVGSIGGGGGIKMASGSTPSTNEPAKDLILVHNSTAKTNDKSTNLRKNVF